MPRYETDDDLYRARLVYVGPPGYTLPFQLPYAQYALFAAIAGALSLLGWLLTRNGLVVSSAIGISIFATFYIWGHVDPDLPARKILATAATDWRRTKQSAETRLPAMSARRIRIGDQS